LIYLRGAALAAAIVVFGEDLLHELWGELFGHLYVALFFEHQVGLLEFFGTRVRFGLMTGLTQLRRTDADTMGGLTLLGDVRADSRVSLV